MEPVVWCPEASALLCAASLSLSRGRARGAQCLFQFAVVCVVFLCDTSADSSPDSRLKEKGSCSYHIQFTVSQAGIDVLLCDESVEGAHLGRLRFAKNGNP